MLTGSVLWRFTVTTSSVLTRMLFTQVYCTPRSQGSQLNNKSRQMYQMIFETDVYEKKCFSAFSSFQKNTKIVWSENNFL